MSKLWLSYETEDSTAVKDDGGPLYDYQNIHDIISVNNMLNNYMVFRYKF